MVNDMAYYEDTAFLKACSSVFSSRNINETAWYGSTENNNYIFNVLSRQYIVDKKMGLRDFFDCVYCILLNHRRSEYVYKNTMIKKKIYGTYSPKTTIWIPEVKIAGARADAIFVNKNKKAVVYEIKTELDSLSRLRDQVQAYYRCFSNVVLVIDSKHKSKVADYVPESVGINVLTKNKAVSVVRESKDFFGFLDSASMFDFLKKKEYESLACSLELDILSFSKFERRKRIRDFFSKEPPRKMHTALLSALSNRVESNVKPSIVDFIPDSLIAAFYEYKIRKCDWLSLIDRFDKPIII